MDAQTADSRECQFCGAWFSRVDAARRHAKRCPKREGRTLLDRKRGRQARSCDQCSRVKVHCSPRGEGPCERCGPRGWECTFNRHQAEVDAPDVPTNLSATCSEIGNRRSGRIPLSFLLNVTDDHQDYLTEEAIWKEPDAVPLGPACLPLLGTDELSLEVLDFLDPSILLLFDHESYNTPSALDEPSPTCEERHPGRLTFTTFWESKISARLDQLGFELSRHAGSSNDRSLSFDSQCYRSFFNVANVHHFITTFCRKRHYRYPIIHWPTFEVESAPLALLLVVSLTGAAYSLGKTNGAAYAVEARQFYKVSDAYVFSELESHLSSEPTQNDPVRSIELCQAALLMYALDTLLTSNLDMQYTAVAIRLPKLISALRKLDFIDIRHEPNEDWQAFIFREQMIRITSWTFCADCLATLTSNKPPGFSAMEMCGDLPCDPAIWESADAFSPDLLGNARQSLSFNLRDLMAHWLNDDWPVPTSVVGLPVFYLHIMLCAFQQVIFNSHVAMSLKQQSSHLLLALDTWRQLWHSTMEQLADHARKWLGVAQHIADLEYLMRRTIEVAVGPEASNSKYLQRIPSVGTGEIHEFMQNFVSQG